MQRGLAAGFAALLLAGSSTCQGVPAETPRPIAEHRVDFELPPVEVALWFVARYPGYFTSGEHDLEPWLASLEPHEREFVPAMAQTLAWAWIEHELADFEALAPEAVAREAIARVRQKTLNQLEVSLELGAADDIELEAYVGDARFADGVFARLVRGASNCEGQNHLLGALIEARLEPRWPWAHGVEVHMIGLPNGHELLRVDHREWPRSMFVDAWSNLPPFVIDDEGDEGDGPRLLELPGQVQLDAKTTLLPDRRGRSVGAPEWYDQSGGTTIVMSPTRRAPRLPVDLAMQPPALDEASLAQLQDPWRIYLYARVLHIYDDPRAAAVYQWLLDHHCPGPRTFPCMAAAALSKRIE